MLRSTFAGRTAVSSVANLAYTPAHKWATLIRPVGGVCQRLYSQPVPSKTFKASSFSLPKAFPDGKQDPLSDKTTNTTKTSGNASAQTTPKPTDFDMTVLVRGTTDLKIAITDRAMEKLAAIAKEDRLTDSALKVKVESGGCHGFQYNFELGSLREELEKDDELAVFQRKDSDLATVVFDESSLEILQDSKLDYTKELIGSSFKMVDSPYTSTSCGCGASFDFDFEKLENAKNNS
ncbi:hypothetical protein JCM33374_g2348 [Metschnikowia sp. JCM 33374]|nr:hypothetical protein JCM33374_g2348 [Metschnikowia sp. JCM 33374]